MKLGNVVFKPEFGNLEHIRILEELGKLKKDELAYLEILKIRKESKSHRDKITERKQKILRWMKQAKVNQNKP